MVLPRMVKTKILHMDPCAVSAYFRVQMCLLTLALVPWIQESSLFHVGEVCVCGSAPGALRWKPPSALGWGGVGTVPSSSHEARQQGLCILLLPGIQPCCLLQIWQVPIIWQPRGGIGSSSKVLGGLMVPPTPPKRDTHTNLGTHSQELLLIHFSVRSFFC